MRNGGVIISGERPVTGVLETVTVWWYFPDGEVVVPQEEKPYRFWQSRPGSGINPERVRHDSIHHFTEEPTLSRVQ